MNYFFDFLFFTNNEKQGSPVNSTEEKLTKAEGKLNEQEELATKDRMGSSPRKGWLDWPFWKKNDSSGGPFNVFSKRAKATSGFTFRKDVNDGTKAKESGKGDGSEDTNVGRTSRENGDRAGTSKATNGISNIESMSGGKSSVRYEVEAPNTEEQ